MAKQDEQRKYPRFSSDGEIRIFTSIVNTSYTVRVRDVSRGGVFIHSRHLPVLGETITYHVLDASGENKLTGHGTVVRLVTGGREQDLGFGVCFDRELGVLEQQHMLAAPGGV